MAMKESSDQPIDLSIRRQNAMVQPIDLEHDFPWKKSIVDVRERATLPPSKQEISIEPAIHDAHCQATFVDDDSATDSISESSPPELNDPSATPKPEKRPVSSFSRIDLSEMAQPIRPVQRVPPLNHGERTAQQLAMKKDHQSKSDHQQTAEEDRSRRVSWNRARFERGITDAFSQDRTFDI